MATSGSFSSPCTDDVVVSGTYDRDAGEITLVTKEGETVVITGITSTNIYTDDGALTGLRTVDMAGNDILWQNGGEFFVENAVRVTDFVEAFGLTLTDVQVDADVPNGTVYVTDGSASGFPAGEVIYKDSTGTYHQLENTPHVIDLDCYQEPTTQPFNFSNTDLGLAGTPSPANSSAIVYTPDVDITLNSISVQGRTPFGSATVSLQIRSGAGIGGTVLFTSTAPATFSTTPSIQQFDFPGAVLSAGQDYSFTYDVNSLALIIREGDVEGNLGFFTGGVLGAPDPLIEIDGLQVDPAGEQYTVVTYEGGDQRAFNKTTGAETDITAGLPASWAPCDVIPTYPSYISNVEFNDNELIFTGENDAFSGTLDLTILRSHRANIPFIINPGDSGITASKEDAGKFFYFNTGGLGSAFSITPTVTGDAVFYVKPAVSDVRLNVVQAVSTLWDPSLNVVDSATGGIKQYSLPLVGWTYKVTVKDGQVDILPWIPPASSSGGGSGVLGEDLANLDAVNWTNQDQHNLALPSGSGFEVDIINNVDLTGIVAPATDNTVLLIVNHSVDRNIKIKNDNTNSVAENRFLTPGGGDFDIRHNGSTYIYYDTSVQRWRVHHNDN